MRYFARLALMCLLIIVFIVGCAQQERDLKVENEQLKSRIQELEEIVESHSYELEKCQKLYELRNIIDIKSRKIVSALNDRNIDVLKEELADNISIKEDALIIEYEGYTTEEAFLDNDVDFEKLRQRYYLLDDKERFITGYEVESATTDDRCVLVFTFIEDSSGWKLCNIERDR